VLAEGETARIYFDGGAPVISAFSGNANVVKVSSSGLVTAVSPGTATVYVTGANGASGTVAFTVTPKGLKVSGKAGITVGETARLTLSGGETVANVTSSNPSVVSVTGDGTYTGAAEGTATLTVTSRSGKTATFAVTVVKKEGGKASERTLLVDQALQLKVIGSKILSASLEENSGAIAVTGTGKVTALSEGTDTVLLVTDDHQVHRVKVTVNARKGKVSVKEGRLRLRKTAGTGSIVAHLANGAAVTILERAGIYYRVQATVNGKTYTGFVPRSYVKK
ncbi:MAG: SH3 domain-containing protein, partial [Chloroflexi bacterium]|nr:SH3 domain-containing protein [Chloroflexota bacterium]